MAELLPRSNARKAARVTSFRLVVCQCKVVLDNNALVVYSAMVEWDNNMPVVHNAMVEWDNKLLVVRNLDWDLATKGIFSEEGMKDVMVCQGRHLVLQKVSGLDVQKCSNPVRYL